MQKLVIVLVLSALLYFFYSCKKGNDESAGNAPEGQRCMLHSVVNLLRGCKDSASIFYDQQGRISSVIRVNGCVNSNPSQPLISRMWFVYSGNMLYMLDTSFMSANDTLIVDAALRIVEHRMGRAPGGYTALGRFQYNTQGLLQSSVYTYGAGIPDTTYYTFENGDLKMAANSGDTLRYFYYEDKKVPSNGYLTQNGFDNGSAFLYKNEHLLKEITNKQGASIKRFSYDFDGYGNVIRKLTDNGSPSYSNTDTLRYDYTCTTR